MTADIVERLRAPAYWISGSSEGHEGENSAPMEAADAIEILRVELAKVNMENDRLTRTNRAKREHRDKLLAAKMKDAAEIERLRVQNIQMQAALGYSICAEDERHIIPSNPFKCGVCDSRTRAWKEQAARIEQLEAALREIADMDEVAIVEFKIGEGWLHQRVARAALAAPSGAVGKP